MGGAFVGIMTMVVQGYTLKYDVVIAKRGFEVISALFINDMEGGHVGAVL